MNDTQGRIAILYRIHNNTHGKQIINLIDGLILILHFFVDAEEMLYAPVNLCFDAGIFNMLTDLIHNALDIFFADILAHRNFIHQIIISFRFQIFQGKIIQLHFDFGNTESLRNGRIDIQSFSGNALLAFRLLVL